MTRKKITTWEDFVENHHNKEDYKKDQIYWLNLCQHISRQEQMLGLLNQEQRPLPFDEKHGKITKFLLLQFFVNVGGLVLNNKVKQVAMSEFDKDSYPVTILLNNIFSTLEI